MERSRVQNIVKGWHAWARRERDPVAKFVFLWSCFNAWLAFESREDSDADMITWLGSAGPSSELVSAYSLAERSDDFVRNLRALTGLAPIQATGRRRRTRHIRSAHDFPGIVGAIYQVRCNLFHGQKGATESRDTKLVIVSGRILEKWIGNLVANWQP